MWRSRWAMTTVIDRGGVTRRNVERLDRQGGVRYALLAGCALLAIDGATSGQPDQATRATISGSAQARAKAARRRSMSRPSNHTPMRSATGASQPGWMVKL